VDRDPLVKLPPALAPFGSEPSARQAHYLLGIDGGATKTLAAVLDVERGALHVGHGGSSNQDAVGVQAAGRGLFEAADEALAAAGIEDAQLDAAVLAVAGTDTDAVEAHVRAERSREWIVVGDVVGAWATATGARPGVGAISGTGSNVFGVGRVGDETRAWRAGGWGHLLGDEGSGYWLGVQSIKAALRDRERSGPETPLSEAAVEFFGACTVEAMATQVYSVPLTKDRIAAFARRTAALAEQGDPVARELYERGAAELAQQITAVIHQTGLQGAFPVGLIGSAWKAGAVFVDPLTRALHATAPEAQVAVVEMNPVGGSLLLAARAAGAEAALAEIDLAGLIEGALAARTG
jgi:glucosamine kinase